MRPEPILARLEKLGIRLGLDEIRRLLQKYHQPQLHYPTVLIAGSNGKGSTAALLAAMASAAGYRTGLYTSPHLETVEERLRIDGQAMSSEALGGLLEMIVETAEQGQGVSAALPTYFEALTAGAFLWFSQRRVDLAVVEVGLGGRLDATNLCDPLLSLITSISLEHREHLGDTLAAIAREKAGIFRPGRPALVWIEEPEPAEAVRAVAAELGTDLRFAPELAEIRDSVSLGWDGQRVRLVTPEGEHDLKTDLPGAHQARNLALAVLAAETLRANGFEKLDSSAIATGAAACRWPGRLERIVLPGGKRVLLDAAHNEEGAAALAAFLDEIPGPLDLLFGVLGDKDVTAMLGQLAPRARRILLTTPASDRARRPEELAALLSGRSGVEIEPDPGSALSRALDSEDGTLVVCGSIYLVGDVRKRLRDRFGVPPSAAEPLYYISGS